MSLSTTLASALSGLTIASRRADVASTNIANAGTPGYVRRELAVSSRLVGDVGHGAQVDGVARIADPVLVGDRRNAEAGSGRADVFADFTARIETAFGKAGSDTSLSERIGALETALIAANGQPSSMARLSGVLDAAQRLSDGLNRASSEVQATRMAADARIAAEVDQLNASLRQVHDLNVAIVSHNAAGRDVTALMDRRQRAIDSIAAIVPLREVERGQGRISLYTPGGAILLESTPATITFDRTPVITADMSALPGLILNGQSVRSGAGAPMGGGTLGALFEVRDKIGTEAQARLDALARDLSDRMASVDSVGGTGLFTDAGNAVTPAGEAGLAARLSLNPAVDPQRGGAIWRLRDGLGAATAGLAGDGSRLKALAESLSSLRAPSSSSGVVVGQGARSLSGLAGEFMSQTATLRLSAEADAVHHTARAEALQKMELAKGVDTDAELQDLLLIEQAWSANARVLKTVDDMIRILMGF